MKYNRPYTENELRDMFINQNLSAQQIADKYNLPRSRVETSLRKYCIKKPNYLKHPERKIIDKEQLYDYYIVQDFTMVQTAEHFGVGDQLVRKYCRLYGFYKDRKDLDLKMKKKINRDELIQYYITENHSNEETAQYFGMHERTLRRRLREFNIRKSVELQVECSKTHQIEKYGDLFTQSQYYHQNVKDKMLDKVYQTCEKKYGCKHVSQLESVKEKMAQTCINKYGVPLYTLTKEFHTFRTHKYKYDGISFDSSWELALWIYAKEHNESIQRTPCRLTYYCNNKRHYYFPDFLYKGMLIEIKGDHLLDENGHLIDFYKTGLETQISAKQQCMEDNNVFIWTYSNIKFALDYVCDKYGASYLHSFSVKKQKSIEN